ncbi:universal stress protein [Liquorilactobacillus vini]|uniref:Universal stress protein UspA family protein n=1 Tax=Liquorilactobacillus vini DSM 20605 TaxID=1133569 RepID=A0A0R2CB59_9LACO|nr:universal stress protein [Liquorilactobacillus vini]KRM88602.1 universal stress protein UspA family protein [Liquorilactobacillus vini DSM 20605]
MKKHDVDLNFELANRLFSEILVAVDEDDSESSLAAFKYALSMAKTNQATLGIVTVLELEDLNVFEALSPEKRTAIRQNLEAALKLYIAKAHEVGVEKVKAFIREGKPAATIINDVIPVFRPDVLICGSKTKPINNRQKIFIGSQASYLAQNAPCSVMVIRPSFNK